MRFDFLMCSERSGSNLITKILNAHPEVCGPFPSHIIRTVLLNYHRYGDLGNDRHWEALIEDVAYFLRNMFAVWKTCPTEAQLRTASHRTFAELVRIAYEMEAEAHGKTRVFVKENHSYVIAPYVLSHFPGSCFVALVRDPRDMALRWKQTAQWGGVRTAARQWRTDQSAMLRICSQLQDMDRLFLLRFEELVTTGREVLEPLCSFLGLDYSPQMLRFSEQDLVGTNAQRMPEWADLQKPLMPDNVGRFRGELSEVEIRYVEAMCAEEMDALGYTPDYDASIPIGALDDAIADERESDRVLPDVEREAKDRFWRAVARIENRSLHRAESPERVGRFSDAEEGRGRDDPYQAVRPDRP